jgi:FMN-dependent NADH-azoreductase
MAKLLYIQASSKDRSHASTVALKFLEAYAKHHPEDTIETLDLRETHLPAYDGHTLKAHYNMLQGRPLDKEEEQAWHASEDLFNHFNAADKYVMSVPMWNFDLPDQLKQFIDFITQPGLALKLTPAGTYEALVTGKPAVLIYANGGTYGPGTGSQVLDYQKPYMKSWLQLIGFKDIQEVVTDSNLMSKVKSEETKAIKKAEKIASTF